MCYLKDGTLYDRREMLKVKAKSLADEARTIRKEERRTRGEELRAELHWHRVGVVRREARATHLAYGIVLGRPLDRIERPKEPRDKALLAKVATMVKKYGPLDKARQAEMLAVCG